MAGADRGEHQRDQEHEHQGERGEQHVVDAEAGDQADHQDDDALQQRRGRAAQRAAEHDGEPWHRCHQGFLEEAELAVPDDFYPAEHRVEDDAHCNDAGRHELQAWSPWPALAKIGPKP